VWEIKRKKGEDGKGNCVKGGRRHLRKAANRQGGHRRLCGMNIRKREGKRLETEEKRKKK
jgi:hypothetical protein